MWASCTIIGVALGTGASSPDPTPGFLQPRPPLLHAWKLPGEMLQENDRQPTDEGWEAVDEGPGLEVTIRNELLDRVDFELDRGSFFGGDQGEVEVDRRSFGVRLRSGDSTMSWYLGAFAERIELDGPLFTVGSGAIRFQDEVEAIGVELGAGGSTVLGQPSSWGLEPVLDYELGLSYRYGDGDDLFDSLWFLEAVGRLGGGVGFHGFQCTAGVVGSAVLGGFDVDPGSGRSLEGSNLGAYLRAAYIGREAPVIAHLQGMLGDVQGFSAGFGLRF